MPFECQKRRDSAAEHQGIVETAEQEDRGDGVYSGNGEGDKTGDHRGFGRADAPRSAHQRPGKTAETDDGCNPQEAYIRAESDEEQPLGESACDEDARTPGDGAKEERPPSKQLSDQTQP